MLTDIEIEAIAKKVVSLIDPTVKKNSYRKSIKIQRAAETLDCSRDKIYDLINSGLLETVNIKGTKYITIKSLEALQTAK